MIKQFELFNGTFHETNIGTRARAVPELPEKIPPLRAETTSKEIGKVATQLGLINVVEVEFGELDKESIKSLDRIKKVCQQLGETATPLVVVSAFAALAVALSETSPNPSVHFGWPSDLERDETGRILYANQIATLPLASSQRQPGLSQQTLTHNRRIDLLNEEATPRPIVNLSTDHLTLNGQPLDQREVLEPHYSSEIIGTTLHGDAEIIRQQRGVFSPHFHMSSDYLNVVHSSTLLAMQLAEDPPFGYTVASSAVMARVGRDPETGEQTSEISEFAVYGPETVKNYAKLL